MSAFRHILCPVDFSEASRHALDHAMAISQWYGGTVTALHVLQVAPVADPLDGPAMLLTRADVDSAVAALDRFVLAEVGTAPVEKLVLIGSAASTIADEAVQAKADLIVTGTHGRSGLERLLIGSVTERLLRIVTCPVLTVPPRAPDAVPVGPVMFKRILCPTDFSPAANRALEYAESLARESGAALTMLHVMEAAPVLELVPAEGGLSPAAMREMHLVRMRELAPQGMPVSCRVANGAPDREILRHAGLEHSDLIVLGVHSRLADRLHFGSTTNHIVREAACPVLSLRD